MTKVKEADDSSLWRETLRLVLSSVGLFTSYSVWGYLQEKISSQMYGATTDSAGQGEGELWHFPYVLNGCMACVCALTVIPILCYQNGPSVLVPRISTYWQASITNTVASPFGYMALKFIRYPLFLLLKSCKLVPVMFMSFIVSGRRFSRIQIISVVVITVGVYLFSCKTNPLELLDSIFELDDPNSDPSLASIVELAPESNYFGFIGVIIDILKSKPTLLGIGLVGLNLLLDGFTNATQDKIMKTHPDTSSFELMYNMNVCGTIVHLAWLLLSPLCFDLSELQDALVFLSTYPEVRWDILLFCLTAATGQCFIFYIIATYDSIVLVTIAILRKMFSLLMSVVLFGHDIHVWQGVGAVAVFVGLAVKEHETYRIRAREKASESILQGKKVD